MLRLWKNMDFGYSIAGNFSKGMWSYQSERMDVEE
jgi:hypothetical protein